MNKLLTLLLAMMSFGPLGFSQTVVAIKDAKTIMVDVGRLNGIQSEMRGFVVSEPVKDGHGNPSIIATIKASEVWENYFQAEVTQQNDKIKVGMQVAFFSLPHCPSPIAKSTSTEMTKQYQLLDQASTYLLNAQYQSALEVYRKLAEFDPTNPLLLHFIKTCEAPIRMIEKRRVLKMSYATIKTMATTLETYYVDENCYAKTGVAIEKLEDSNAVTVDFGRKKTEFRYRIPDQSLREMLSPTYIKEAQLLDSWGYKLDFLVERDDCPQQYLIRTPGTDGKFDKQDYHSGEFFSNTV